MIRKRFPNERIRRVAAWTAVTVTWATALVARTVGAPAAEPAGVPPPATPSPAATVDPAGSVANIPDMPEDGLVILRYTPAPPPEAEIQRIVVSRQAPSSAATPTTKRSSGS